MPFCFDCRILPILSKETHRFLFYHPCLHQLLAHKSLSQVTGVVARTTLATTLCTITFQKLTTSSKVKTLRSSLKGNFPRLCSHRGRSKLYERWILTQTRDCSYTLLFRCVDIKVIDSPVMSTNRTNKQVSFAIRWLINLAGILTCL